MGLILASCSNRGSCVLDCWTIFSHINQVVVSNMGKPTADDSHWVANRLPTYGYQQDSMAASHYLAAEFTASPHFDVPQSPLRRYALWPTEQCDAPELHTIEDTLQASFMGSWRTSALFAAGSLWQGALACMLFDMLRLVQFWIYHQVDFFVDNHWTRLHGMYEWQKACCMLDECVDRFTLYIHCFPVAFQCLRRSLMWWCTTEEQQVLGTGTLVSHHEWSGSKLLQWSCGLTREPIDPRAPNDGVTEEAALLHAFWKLDHHREPFLLYVLCCPLLWEMIQFGEHMSKWVESATVEKCWGHWHEQTLSLKCGWRVFV